MAISLRLSERLGRRLAAAAKARGVSKSELIRRCLGEYLMGPEHEPLAWQVGKNLFGCYDSKRGDLSIRAKHIARERAHAQTAKKRGRG